jgi:putative transposase
MKIRGKPQKRTPGQQRLPWDTWEAPDPEIQKVAKKFVLANALNPEIAAAQFDQDCSFEQKTINSV